MEYTIKLPEDFTPNDVQTTLEQEWLIPKKVRHFLRMKKNVQVNGEVVVFHHILNPGDLVTLTFDDEDYLAPTIIPNHQQPVEVLYEDEHILIVDKPVGLKTHPNSPDEENTLLNYVAAYLADQNLNPFVVHRLDQETSGAILFAKNQFILPILSRMLENREVKRSYQAIASGAIREKELTIDKKIGRDRHDSRKQVIDDRRGKRAITHVKVRHYSPRESWITCTLETGRTHQIRVHLESIGHPIVGDPLYHPQPSKAKRLMLHASKLSLIHPLTKIQVNAESPTPF